MLNRIADLIWVGAIKLADVTKIPNRWVQLYNEMVDGS